MNLLIDDLPTTVHIDTTEYPINSDFRTCLRVVIALEDNDLTAQEKQMIVLANLYSVVPNDVQAAMREAQLFLNGGKEYQESDSPRVVSFEKDAPLIYSAFCQTHGIDLSHANLHWWQFLALMQGLDNESNFRQLVSLRLRVRSGKASKDEMEAARNLGDAFDVPEVDDRTSEEKEAEAEFWRLIDAAERNRNGG